MAQTGIDALVLVTNHLDPRNEGSEVFSLPCNRCWRLYLLPCRWGCMSARRRIAACLATTSSLVRQQRSFRGAERCELRSAYR